MAYTRRGKQIRVSGPAGSVAHYYSTGSTWITNTPGIRAYFDSNYPSYTTSGTIVQLIPGNITGGTGDPWVAGDSYNNLGTVSGHLVYWREQSYITQGQLQGQGNPELHALTFFVRDINAPWSFTVQANRVSPLWTLITSTNITLGANYIGVESLINLSNWSQEENDFLGSSNGVLVYPTYNDTDFYVETGYFDQAGFSVDVNVPVAFPDADLQPPTTWFGEVATTATTTMLAYGQQATFVNATATSVSTFTGTVIKESGSLIDSDFEQVFSGRNIINGQVTTASDFQSTFDGQNIKGGELIESAEFTATFSAGIIRGTATVTIESTTTQSTLGGMILDIGYNYAAGWVDPYPPYAEPALVQSYALDSNLFCAPTLEFIVDANIQAQSLIDVTGGYLRVAADVLMNAESQLDVGQFQAGTSAGVIMRPVVPTFESTTAFEPRAGLIPFFGMIISADAEFYSIAGNAISGVVPLVNDFELGNTTDLFKGPDLPIFAVETQSTIVGGFRQDAAATLVEDFITLRWSGKIISLDEYYVERVFPETRRLSVLAEPRTLIIDSDLRTWIIFPEDRIANTPAETRRIKPELGPPQQIARRIRRVTA